MGGSQSQYLTASEINEVISGTITNQLMQFWTSTAINNSNVQVIIGSSNCENIDVTEGMVEVTVSTSEFQDAETYQSTVTDIVNDIQAAQDAKSSGVSTGGQDENLTSLIQNIVENTVTQDTMDINASDASIGNRSVQVCVNSDNSKNVYASSNEQVLDLYYTAYQQNSEVQIASTDIANTMNLSQSEKKEGILHMIIVLVFLLIIIIVIILAVIGIAYVGITASS